MAEENGSGKKSGGVDKCFTWKVQEVGLLTAVSNRLLGKERNWQSSHDQGCMARNGRPSSQSHVRCFEEFGRDSPRDFFS